MFPICPFNPCHNPVSLFYALMLLLLLDCHTLAPSYGFSVAWCVFELVELMSWVLILNKILYVYDEIKDFSSLIALRNSFDQFITIKLFCQAVYEHHPRPKQLIVENDLPQKLQNLIEERRDGQRSGGQVLVKQMATSLLKALHINTVL